MKRRLSLLLVATFIMGCLVGCGSGENSTNNGGADKDTEEYAVGMITDYGDVTDLSFNQTTYEACKAFCEENNIDFKYFKPKNDSTADRVACVPISKQELTKVVQFMAHRIEAIGVDVRLNTPVTKEMLEGEFAGYEVVAAANAHYHLIGDGEKVGNLRDAITRAYEVVKNI